MADIQSNINVNIDTSEALASIKVLQRQISAFYTSMARSGAAANAAVSNMQNNLINTINQTGKFSASVRTVASSTEAFTTSLEKNKFSLGQYFRYAAGASKTFGKSFLTEMQTIDKVARERVKTLQTQYISMGRDANGALKAIAVRPLTLDLKDLGTQTAIAAQKQQILNQLLKQGSTNLLNFGKNTQWAGRQLMVGFTIPLSMVGTAAAKTFMKMEEQAIKFKRVYGDSMTPTAETDAMIKQIRDLATEFTKYGVAAEKTMELAATAAAAGKQGVDLTAQVREANRLAVLGQVEQQDALNTTISITNAFGTAATDLAKKIDFLNAVENQTVTSIEDLTIAVPKAGPVVQQLGGDVEDLAFFLTAMKEGGINASEGANALKSGLAALINPTGKASEMLAGFGINVKNIVESNKGDVKGLVLDFASALDTLDPLSRARAIEQLFGKFQFSRLSTLFQNVIKDGTQASRVLDLTTQSSSELAALASKELGTVAASSMFKFQKSVEELKIALAPIGEIFLKLVTPIIEFGTKVLENFNKLDSGAKNFIVGLIAVVGGLGPVLLMTFGLLANGVANIIKGFMLVRRVFTGSAQDTKYLGDQTEYMTQQQLEATGVAASLEQVHQRLEQRFTSEATAVNALTQALERAVRAQMAFQGTGGVAKPVMPKKYAKGVVSVPGPKGAGDIIPAMLAPGEAVIPSKQAAKYAALIQGIVADNLPGYEFSNVDTSGSSQALGQAKRGGGRSIPIPGAYEQAHFDTRHDLFMSLRELQQMMSDQGRVFSRKAQTAFTQIMEVSGQGLDTVVRVWSDKVILLNRDLHKLFTSNAVGAPATQVPVSLVKEKLEPGGQGTHAKMYQELLNLGVSEKEAEQKVAAIQNELIATLEKLPEGATIIGDQFDELVQEAYNTIAKVDTSVKEAQDRMARITTFQDKYTKEKPRRITLGGGQDAGYNEEVVARKNRTIGNKLSGGLIPVDAQMKITGSLEAATQKTTDQIYAALKQLPDKIRQRLASIRMDPELFAQEFLAAVEEFGVGFEVAAEKIKSKTKEGTSRLATETIEGAEQGLNEIIQRNSLPKRAIQIGRDYGFALNGALSEMIPKAKVAGEAFGIAATTGITVTPAMRQHLHDNAGKILRPYLDAQGRLIPIASQKIEILNREAIAAREAAAAQETYIQVLDRIAAKAASMPQSPLPLRPGDPRFIGPLRPGDPGFDDRGYETQAVPKTTGNLEKFSGTVRNSSFVLTSLAAAGTMSGGVIGEMAGKVMQFSGIIFAATTLMDIMVAAQQRHILAQLAHTKAIEAGTIAAGTQMKTGFLATMSNFLMFSKGKAGGVGFFKSLKNSITPLTAAFAAGGKGFKGFINVLKTGALNIGRFVVAALRFVPVIGWIIGGLTILGLVIKAIVDAKERERLATEGVSDAMISTTKELDATAEALGKEKPKSVMDRLGFGGSAQEAQQQLSVVEQARSNQGFLDEYKADIAAMQTMSQRELKTYQNTLAIQLQADGQYTQAEIQGIIKALQLEAKRTDVKLDFKSIDITKPENIKANLKTLEANATDFTNESLNETQRTESRNIAIAGYYQNIISLATAFQNGVIDLKAYNQGLEAVKNSLNTLGEATKTEMVQGIFEEFKANLPETQQEFRGLLDGVKNSNQQIELMSLYTSGAIDSLSQLKDVINAMNIVSAGLGGAVTQQVLDAANRVLASARLTADKNNTETENSFKKLNSNANGTKSIFEQATEQLRNNLNEIKETTKAYTVLSKAGLSAADSFTIAKDPILAAALASTKVGTGKWKELLALINQFLAKGNIKTLTDEINSLTANTELTTQFDKLSKYLMQMGLSAEDVASILENEDLAKSLLFAMRDGLKGAKEVEKFVNAKLANIDVNLRFPSEKFVKTGIQKAMDYFSTKESVLNLKFQIDTKANRAIVTDAQKKIRALNFQADDFEAGLTRLEDGEEAINEKYDNRIEALDKIIEANNRIAEQNKEELNIFQMVARGDISGAAAGIAQLQQQKAKDALEAKKASLEAQRTNELESLTADVVVNGQRVRMTRNEIEENLKKIKQDVFNIEEDTLEPAQNLIDLAQDKLDLDIVGLSVAGKTKDEWDLIDKEIENAKVSTTAYLKVLEDALIVAKQIPSALAGKAVTGDDIVGQQDPILRTDFGDNPRLKNVPPPSGPGGPGNPRTAADVEADKEAAAAARSSAAQATADSKLLASVTKVPTYGEIFKYQSELNRKVVMPWEEEEHKRKIKAFEAAPPKGFGKTAWNGLPWKDVKGPFNGITTDGQLVQNVKWTPGGPTLKKASGGYISGPGTGTSDSIPALLSNGEYVIRANAVKALGTDTLDKMNYADKNRFADGGFVDRRDAAMAARGAAQPKPKPKSSSNPIVSMAAEAFRSFSDPLHNIKTSVESIVGSGANVVSGKGDGWDYLNLASLLPIGKPLAAISKFAKPIKDKIKYAVNPEGSRESNLVGLTRLITGNRRGVYGSSGPDFYEKGAIRNFIRSNPNVGVRMPEENLVDLINSKDKRYKSIFESGRSNLNDSIADRELVENKIFGLTQGMEHSKRPVYGFMYNAEKPQLGNKMRRESLFTKLTGKPESMDSRRSVKSRLNYSMFTATNNKDLDRYGNATLVLKKRNIKDRTTFTYGDSYNNRQDRWPTPAPMGTMSSQAIKKSYNSRVRKEFIETQIMGGFTLNDVKKIIATDPKTIAMLQDALKAQNINIPVGLPELTKFQKLREILFPKRYKPIEKPDTTPIDYSKYEDELPFADGGLVDRRDLAMAARGPNAVRDKLYKKGGAQGFEAGIQGMMSDFGQNGLVRGFGNFLNDKDNLFAMRTRNALGTLSLPAELMGATAKTITTATGQASKGKMFEAMGTLIRGSMGGNFIDALNNAYSGVADPTKQKSSLFQQASEQVIKNKAFGTGNAESDAWARIVGGALNFVGDPLSYLGVGIAARGLKASASAATSSAKIGQYSSSLKNVGKAAGFAPGLLGLPNLSDVQSIKSLFTSGKATSTTSSIAKTDAFDPFEDSPISNLDSPTFSGISASQIQQKVSEAVSPETVVLDEAIQELLKNGSLANLTSFGSPSTGGFRILPEDLGTDIKSLIQGLPTDVVIGKQELGVYSDQISRVIESALRNAAMRELTIFQKVPKKRIVDILKERKLLHQFHPEFAKKGIDPKGMFANSRVPGTGGFAYNFRTRAESSMFNVPLTEDVVRPVYGYAALSPHTPLDARQFGFRTFSPFGLTKTLGEWDTNGLDLSALGNVPPVIAREFTQKFRNMSNALSTPVDDIKGLSNYGGITLEYKDSIKEFTTGTIGDTIYSSEALPMPFAKTTREFLERNGYPNTKVHYDIGTQERYSTIGQAARYVEAQILQNYKTTNALDHLKAIHVDDISSTLLKELVSVRDDMYPGVAIIDRLTGNTFKDGGMVKPKFFAKGGMVMPQFFSKGGDVVPAMLTPGEFVVNKHAVEDYGVNNLRAINSGTAPGNSVYNGYNINVNVKSNSNPDQIANAVMTQIRQVNAQQVRGNRF